MLSYPHAGHKLWPLLYSVNSIDTDKADIQACAKRHTHTHTYTHKYTRAHSHLFGQRNTTLLWSAHTPSTAAQSLQVWSGLGGWRDLLDTSFREEVKIYIRYTNAYSKMDESVKRILTGKGQKPDSRFDKNRSYSAGISRSCYATPCLSLCCCCRH